MPVQWRRWSPEAFAETNAADKPVLLSLVTAWSDECAVMDATTYADPRVVALIESRFVPVRVDADRHPDLNDRYNLGGWPTTSFLTGTGEVLTGGTYFDTPRMIAMLEQVADAYRDRRSVIAARANVLRDRPVATAPRHANGDLAIDDAAASAGAIDNFHELLVNRFDVQHGGFGSAPKQPHSYALLLALSLLRERDEERLAAIVDAGIEVTDALRDPVAGGFFRYARGADWSDPASEKTLEDHAWLLHVFVEGALIGRGGPTRDRAAETIRWVRGTLSSQSSAGFFNACTAETIDKTIYVDRNGMMIGALIRAAALFDDVWLRDFALEALEAVIVPTYLPGSGVAHVARDDRDEPRPRGLLTDQVHAALALIWAHAATGQLPYSMLAAELLTFAVRAMWHEAAGCLRDRISNDDPLIPFELNCHAAIAFGRLAAITGEAEHHTRARTILETLGREYQHHDLAGAVYGLAVREIVDGYRPAGLVLAHIDWGLT